MSQDELLKSTAALTQWPSPDKAEENVTEATKTNLWKPKWREWLVIICCCVIAVVVALDATILVPLLPVIVTRFKNGGIQANFEKRLSESLGGTPVETFWTGTAYLVPCAVFQPFITSLSDLFGRRPLLFLSLSLFTVGTLVCCLAGGFPQLLTGRVVQGIGGAGSMSVCYVILADIIPLRQRPLYFAILSLAGALGTIVGPLIGGLFVQYSIWQWAFYINFPFCGMGLALVLVAVKLKSKPIPLKAKLVQIDWAGATLFVASACSFLIGLSWGGTQFPWSSWHTLIPIVLGMVGLGGSIYWENSIASRPFLRVQLFKKQSTIVAYICIFIQGLMLFCELYYIPIYLESVKDLSPTLAGVGLIPISAVVLPTSAVCGALISKYGRFRWAIWSGWGTTIIATSLLLLLDPNIKTYGWVLIFAAVGLGHGLNFTALSICVQAFADTPDVSYAAGLYTFMRTFGMCIGVPIGGTVFQNRFNYHIRDLDLPYGVSTNAEVLIETLKKITAPPDLRQSLHLAYAESFQDVVKVLIGLAVVGGVSSLFLESATMDRQLESEHVLEGA
ncbi:unnamed protein product [Penicillium salamii]|uniref:Major facilitator superfamily (MFS) profile domain-containing protein n=1 Tax=Penicillium salamii TaxID=1612424 RepID=A0A9W4ISG2_9EURO|nr:unnamed protein product [Penicillium salamii]CAG8904278.1 unnamed protein product [Penicillium salamii]